MVIFNSYVKLPEDNGSFRFVGPQRPYEFNISPIQNGHLTSGSLLEAGLENREVSLGDPVVKRGPWQR